MMNRKVYSAATVGIALLVALYLHTSCRSGDALVGELHQVNLQPEEDSGSSDEPPPSLRDHPDDAGNSEGPTDQVDDFGGGSNPDFGGGSNPDFGGGSNPDFGGGSNPDFGN